MDSEEQTTGLAVGAPGGAAIGGIGGMVMGALISPLFPSKRSVWCEDPDESKPKR